MDKLGQISSIITLISFLLYFIGKIIKIKLSKNLRFENIEVYYDSEDLLSNAKIVEEYNIGDVNSEKIIISSEMPLNWIKIYDCEFDEKKNTLKKGNLIANHGILKTGHAISINTYLSCGIPSYLIEFQRYDYLKGRFFIAENGKNGILDEQVIMFHTLASYLYYVFE